MLTPIQQQFADIVFFGAPDEQPYLEEYTSLFEKVLAFFDHKLPQVGQFMEFWQGNYESCENTPESLKLCFKSGGEVSSEYLSLPDSRGIGQCAHITFMRHPDLGSAVVFTIEDSSISGIDSGLVYCNQLELLQDLFPSGILIVKAEK